MTAGADGGSCVDRPRSIPLQSAAGPPGCDSVPGRDALEEGEIPPPFLQGAQPTPSYCLPDGNCQLEWHL